jgi:hypothetical protein
VKINQQQWRSENLREERGKRIKNELEEANALIKPVFET